MICIKCGYKIPQFKVNCQRVITTIDSVRLFSYLSCMKSIKKKKRVAGWHNAKPYDRDLFRWHLGTYGLAWTWEEKGMTGFECEDDMYDEVMGSYNLTARARLKNNKFMQK